MKMSSAVSCSVLLLAATTRRYGVEVYFNGVLVQPQIVVTPDMLNVAIETPPFTLQSVNGGIGGGFDNIVSLKGISYSGEGGGAWLGFDYIQLNRVALKFLPPVVENGTITLNWTGIGQVESAPSINGPWTPIGFTLVLSFVGHELLAPRGPPGRRAWQ